MTRSCLPAAVVVLASLAVLGAATCALYDVLLFARETGLVAVAPRSRGAVREMVPWPRAWAYLSGLVMFIGAAVLGLVHQLTRVRVGGTALAVLALGTFLFMFSGLLVKPISAVALIGTGLGAPVALYYTMKTGRTSVLLWWAGMLLVLMGLAWHA